MMSVKAGMDVDAEGEKINNVETVLNKYGVMLRDSNQTFRSMSDVLADAAKKYKELGKAGNTVAQSQITTAIAGEN